MIRHKLLVALMLVGACAVGLSHPPVHAETARPFIRVYYRWDREWQQGPFLMLYQARKAMNDAFEKGDHEVRIIYEPLMDEAGNSTGVQYYVSGVTREAIQSRDFSSRAEAKRFYDFQRQAGFKVAHTIFK